MRFNRGERTEAAQHGLADCPAGGRTGTGTLARKRKNLIGHAPQAAPEGHAVPAGVSVCLLKSTQQSALNIQPSATEC